MDLTKTVSIVLLFEDFLQIYFEFIVFFTHNVIIRLKNFKSGILLLDKIKIKIYNIRNVINNSMYIY